MPGIALMGGSSSVSCTDGAKGSPCGKNVWHWDTGTTQASAAGSGDVFVNNIGVVRQGDAMGSHPDGDPCVKSPVNHAPALSSYSGTVYANNKPIGRIGDVYNSDGHFSHSVVSGATTVFANGGGAGLVFASPAGEAAATNGSIGNLVVGPGGGAPNTGVTTRVPLDPKPGEPYTVSLTGVPDGPVTYTDPNTGQPVTVQAVNGSVSIQLTAPAAVTGKDKAQAVDFTLADGSTNSGSLVVIPDAMKTATQTYIDTHPSWRDDFRQAFFKSIGGEPNDMVIVTNPGEWAPGQFWYDFVLNNTPNLPPTED
jgi:hypothetical protein